MRTLSIVSLALAIGLSAASPNPKSEVSSRNSGDPWTINLSEYWNSALFPTIVVISLLIVADIFVSVFYMGESARQRRRLYSLRNYYRRRNFGAPKTRHGHHHHHAIGRMGYSEEAAENPDEYQSLDLVDTTFGLMNVDSEICRQKMICEMEKAVAKNSVLDFVLQNVGSYVNGLSKYENVQKEARNGRLCEDIYRECPHSIVDYSPFKRK